MDKIQEQTQPVRWVESKIFEVGKEKYVFQLTKFDDGTFELTCKSRSDGQLFYCISQNEKFIRDKMEREVEKYAQV